MVNIVYNSKIPIFKQVATAIKRRIRSGDYSGNGSQLPSLRQWSREYGVSLAVVQRAIRKLEEEGLVNVRPGKGIVIADGNESERAAFLFGLLHPYASSAYSDKIVGSAHCAFIKQFNLLAVNSTDDDPLIERDAAEHLIENGVQGLLVWPSERNANGPFFTELAKNIPVILIDRLLTGADLPAVIVDYENCGKEVCTHFFEKQKKSRLLVVMDNLEISSYRDLTRGIEEKAAELGRFSDITIIQLPVTHIINQYANNELGELPQYRNYLHRILAEGGYDSVFVFQDEMVDFIMAQMELMSEFPHTKIATLRGAGQNKNSIQYKQLNPFEWVIDWDEMVSVAAEWLQASVVGVAESRGIKKIKPRLAVRPTLESLDGPLRFKKSATKTADHRPRTTESTH